MHSWITPDWPAPAHVRALITTRAGGVSPIPYGAGPELGGGMNLGFGSGDDPANVAANRARLSELLPAAPRWLRQMHGAQVVDAATVEEPVAADAAYTSAQDVVVVVMIADCLPVLLTDRNGDCVAAAHAGWRGLAAGVLQATVHAMRSTLGDPRSELLAYLGPAIGPRHFEVGDDVLTAMRALPGARDAFVPLGGGKYLADLPALARLALRLAGVEHTFGGDVCTYSESQRFYSHRRDRITGRHAALIWRSSGEPASV